MVAADAAGARSRPPGRMRTAGDRRGRTRLADKDTYKNMNSVNLLGVRIDQVNKDQALEIVEGWLNEKPSHKRYIVTPNIEFLIDSQTDGRFKKILLDADLSIPDSSRFGWLEKVLAQKYPVKKFLIWLLFPFSARIIAPDFPILTGVDLMESLCRLSEEKGYTIGLFGGKNKVADQTKKCLLVKYPKLKIDSTSGSESISKLGELNDLAGIPLIHSDILFIGLGHIKQENFIVNYQDQIDAKIFMGVGGAFDYLSNSVPRAPLFLRQLGLEWLFRLICQPWRIKRQLRIVKFVLELLTK